MGDLVQLPLGSNKHSPASQPAASPVEGVSGLVFVPLYAAVCVFGFLGGYVSYFLVNNIFQVF